MEAARRAGIKLATTPTKARPAVMPDSSRKSWPTCISTTAANAFLKASVIIHPMARPESKSRATLPRSRLVTRLRVEPSAAPDSGNSVSPEGDCGPPRLRTASTTEFPLAGPASGCSKLEIGLVDTSSSTYASNHVRTRLLNCCGRLRELNAAKGDGRIKAIRPVSIHGKKRLRRSVCYGNCFRATQLITFPESVMTIRSSSP